MCTDWLFHICYLLKRTVFWDVTQTYSVEMYSFSEEPITSIISVHDGGDRFLCSISMYWDTLSSIARFLWLLEWIITIAAFNRNYELEEEKVTIMYWISFYFALQFTISWAQKIKNFLLKIWILAPFFPPLGLCCHPRPCSPPLPSPSYAPGHMSFARRQLFSYSLPWDPQILSHTYFIRNIWYHNLPGRRDHC